MKSTGIIAEYNPFHNGHLYHIEDAKKKSKANVIIVVMSGNFLQRGEPALISKWSRTRMALQAGANIVIELPYSFAVQQAKTFAYGAVYLLNALHCEHICFGSEIGKIEPFHEMVRLIQENKDVHEAEIQKQMKRGKSYPQAMATAHAKLTANNATLDLSEPNNILGFHYVNEARKLNNRINMLTIKRQHAHYHDKSFSNETLASATSIRKALHEFGDFSQIEQYVPQTTIKELTLYNQQFGKFHKWDHYWSYLQYRLLTTDPRELAQIYDVEEGLHHRLQRIARSANHFQTFMQAVKTKRYTWTRLQRICVHILTNTTKKAMRTMMKEPSYIRLLGMDRVGRAYINKIKKELSLPLVSKVSSFSDDLLSLDRKATQVYALGLPEPYRGKLLTMEYTQPPIMDDHLMKEV